MTEKTEIDDLDEYAGLTDEEIAALKEITEDTADDDASELEPRTDPDLPEGEGLEPDADQDTGATAKQEPAPQQKQAERAGEASTPDDTQARLDDIAEREAALLDRFDAGAMGAREYSVALRKLTDEREDVRWEARSAELSHEIQEKQRADAWFKEVDAFLADDRHAALKGNQAALVAFDAMVRQVTADPDNAGLTARQQLDKAYGALVGGFSAVVGAAPQSKADASATEQKAAAPRRKLPPTLAKVPAASISETDDGKFAALDRLAERDPDAHEAAIERLSPAEREAYLSFA